MASRMINFLFFFMITVVVNAMLKAHNNPSGESEGMRLLRAENAKLKQEMHKLRLQKALFESGKEGLRLNAMNRLLARISSENASSSMVEAHLVPEIDFTPNGYQTRRGKAEDVQKEKDKDWKEPEMVGESQVQDSMQLV